MSKDAGADLAPYFENPSSRLDLAFFSEVPSPPVNLPSPVNVFRILREGHLETRVDMVLRFFMDPSEQHGLGSLVIDSFLELLEGAQFKGPDGTDQGLFTPEEYLNSESWELNTQVENIDLYALNRDLGLAIVVENKIEHDFNNPVDKYVQSAHRDLRSAGDGRAGQVLMVAIAPRKVEHEHRTLRKWVTAAITYSQLSDSIRSQPGLTSALLRPADSNQHRSLELLQQFIEFRTEIKRVEDRVDDLRLVAEWNELNQKYSEEISAFKSREKQVKGIINQRLEELEAPVLAKFESEDRYPTPSFGKGVTPWLRFDFQDPEWTVELKFTSAPGSEKPIFVYSHNGRHGEAQCPELDVDFTANDEEITAAFVQKALEILEERS